MCAQIRWRFNEAFIGSDEILSVPVEDSCRLMQFIPVRRRLLLLCLLQSLLAHLLVSLHQLLLIFVQICFLSLEILHAFVQSPRSLEISRRGVSLLLASPLQLFSVGFATLVFVSCVDMVGIHDVVRGKVTGVLGAAEILKLLVLLTELARINVDLLYCARQVVLFCDQFIVSFKCS